MTGELERRGEEAFREDQERRHLHPSTRRGAHSTQTRRAAVRETRENRPHAITVCLSPFSLSLCLSDMLWTSESITRGNWSVPIICTWSSALSCYSWRCGRKSCSSKFSNVLHYSSYSAVYGSSERFSNAVCAVCISLSAYWHEIINERL